MRNWERWQQMSPEERAQARQQIREQRQQERQQQRQLRRQGGERQESGTR
jgi:hypothetical protein